MKEPRLSSSSQSPMKTKNQQILLVDDEEGIRKVLGISLADSGYHVVTAANGEKALALFKNMDSPIVLTDIKMPGMDGIQLLRKIKKDSPDTEVIMITGHGDMELAIQSLKFGAVDFITKPLNDDALEIALKRAKEKIVYRETVREYTENLEQLVYEKTKKLLQTERLAAVAQTVSAMAHAIKNITGGLTGGAFVLEKGLELENKKYLDQGWDMLKRNIERVKQLALDLLSYTKEREPDYQLCDPNQPILEVHQLMLPYAAEYSVSLEVDLDTKLPDAWFDPERINRCLLNLVTNAIDACTDISCNHRQGKVSLRSLRRKNFAVEYEICDNGCGMDEETKAKIFQQFFSTKGSRGTGLGLMITHKIVDEHRGVIECSSELGKGTTFVIRLPVRE